MDWQETTALVIVALTAVMLGAKFLNKRKKGFIKDCCAAGIKGSKG